MTFNVSTDYSFNTLNFNMELRHYNSMISIFKLNMFKHFYTDKVILKLEVINIYTYTQQLLYMDYKSLQIVRHLV
jgi:hypothetical protein